MPETPTASKSQMTSLPSTPVEENLLTLSELPAKGRTEVIVFWCVV